MALLMWTHGEEALAKSLVSCKLYKAMAHEAAEDDLDTEIYEELRSYAKEFESKGRRERARGRGKLNWLAALCGICQSRAYLINDIAPPQRPRLTFWPPTNCPHFALRFQATNCWISAIVRMRRRHNVCSPASCTRGPIKVVSPWPWQPIIALCWHIPAVRLYWRICGWADCVRARIPTSR